MDHNSVTWPESSSAMLDPQVLVERPTFNERVGLGEIKRQKPRRGRQRCRGFHEGEEGGVSGYRPLVGSQRLVSQSWHSSE